MLCLNYVLLVSLFLNPYSLAPAMLPDRNEVEARALIIPFHSSSLINRSFMDFTRLNIGEAMKEVGNMKSCKLATQA